jgi:tRNA (guanine10-N2)-dimethyltransferase
MKCLFELSGEHPTIPISELSCVGTVEEVQPQLAIAECPDPGKVQRLALSHCAMEYLGSCPADQTSLVSLVRDLGLSSCGSFSVRVRRFTGTAMRDRGPELEREIGRLIDGRVDLATPATQYRILCSGNRCYIGRVFARIDRSSFDERRPGARPFFHPGVMMPRIARALVNITGIMAGECLIDPFCGTGGLLIEGILVGAEAVGCDMDPLMVRGALRNCQSLRIIRADAQSLPFRDSSARALICDLPYGQSVMIRGNSLEELYDGALSEVRRVLVSGRKAVIVTHRDVRPIAETYLSLYEYHEQRVHRSLTRRIMVLLK